MCASLIQLEGGDLYVDERCERPSYYRCELNKCSHSCGGWRMEFKYLVLNTIQLFTGKTA